MQEFKGKVAVITGAASGFGREFARIGSQLGMKLVLADVQRDALDAVVDELRATGCQAIGETTDVSKDASVETLADRAYAEFGAVHLLFNNAGVGGGGGLVWECSERDWQWVLNVNLWGVVHGVRHFVPRMLAAGTPGHIVNTASVAGLLSASGMGVYNVSKHAVVTLTETLYHDLKTVNSSLGVSVLCPAYVATGIADSERNRPAELANEAEPTASQKLARVSLQKAVSSGKLKPADIAQQTFEAIRADRFYVLTHRAILPSVELRCQDVLQLRNPTDPFSLKPELKSRV